MHLIYICTPVCILKVHNFISSLNKELILFGLGLLLRQCLYQTYFKLYFMLCKYKQIQIKLVYAELIIISMNSYGVPNFYSILLWHVDIGAQSGGGGPCPPPFPPRHGIFRQGFNQKSCFLFILLLLFYLFMSNLLWPVKLIAYFDYLTP